MIKFSAFNLKERNTVDFHGHTFTEKGRDDGTLSIEEQFIIAEELNHALVSITPHNCIEVHKQAQNPEVRHLFSGIWFPGTEIGVLVDDVPTEVLVYQFNINTMDDELSNLPINASPDAYGRYVTQATNEMISNQFGVNIDFECVDGDCRRWLDGIHKQIIEKCPGRLAKIDPRLEQCRKYFLRKGLLNPDSPLALNMGGIYHDIEFIREMVNSCGDNVQIFYAHPMESHGHMNRVRNYLTENKLINGIECGHPSANPTQQQEQINYCKNHGLKITVGSDRHHHDPAKDNFIKNQHNSSELILQFDERYFM